MSIDAAHTHIDLAHVECKLHLNWRYLMPIKSFNSIGTQKTHDRI